MKKLEKYLADRLADRAREKKLRQLPGHIKGIDFCSNDYLGLASSNVVQDRLKSLLEEEDALGATGSRLISGDRDSWQEIEQQIADFHGAEAALVFGSGYQANLGLLSAIPRRGDTILYDQLIHASLRDGIRLSLAKAFSFRHNDLAHLRQRFEAAEGQVFVVVESLYSMDGDKANLGALSQLCQSYEAALIVDEAHAVGIFGQQGRGLVSDEGLEQEVFARIMTFGKALGAHGAAVIGSDQLKEYLVNFARPFIYTTGLAAHSWWHIKAAYEYLEQADDLRKRLFDLIHYYHDLWPSSFSHSLLLGQGPIQAVLVPGNENTKSLAKHCQAMGLAVKAILHPTVAKGEERLRICLHAFNSEAELTLLVKTILSASQD